ncbi:PepSY-associated TM helix domain-containing protein [Paludisphaera soli]|uniref:PepSY-associated TM helix domain-containing protein n=1 Tax=Paludisphaera soli TaxID=2712865 RepID=UPI0013ECB8D5|nr:PepSY domain-containing protein [Paludisphaera soli]
MNENENGEGRARSSWPDYRAVWRWHFYAGLLCIPFVVVLSISGSLYLFKEEIEAWVDRPYDGLAVQGRPAPASERIGAALAAFPGSTFQGYELPQAADQSTRVIVMKEGRAIRTYVHPETLEVLHAVPEDSRLMSWLFRLHGELLMGNRGSMVVELASSWAIVMIATGLFLWWPRGANRLAGIVYPRLRRGSRIFWRDAHAVTGFWVSGFAIVLLLTGLPWAKFWGDYFRNVRRLTGTAVARQDWTNGAAPRVTGGGGGGHEGHGGMGRGDASGPRVPVDLTAVDRIAATVEPMGLLPPVVIAPPLARSFEGTSVDWTAKSMTANRPYRVDLTMDGDTGAVKSRRDFGEKHVVDRVVGTGIALHEGRLFGWPNQLIGLLTAAGLVTLSVSAVVLWWRRREVGALGVPRALAPRRLSLGLAALVALFGIYLPLFGASLIVVLLAEFLVLRRIPGVRDWLGLAATSSSLGGCVNRSGAST